MYGLFKSNFSKISLLIPHKTMFKLLIEILTFFSQRFHSEDSQILAWCSYKIVLIKEKCKAIEAQTDNSDNF